LSFKITFQVFECPPLQSRRIEEEIRPTPSMNRKVKECPQILSCPTIERKHPAPSYYTSIFSTNQHMPLPLFLQVPPTPGTLISMVALLASATTPATGTGSGAAIAPKAIARVRRLMMLNCILKVVFVLVLVLFE